MFANHNVKSSAEANIFMSFQERKRENKSCQSEIFICPNLFQNDIKLPTISVLLTLPSLSLSLSLPPRRNDNNSKNKPINQKGLGGRGWGGLGRKGGWSVASTICAHSVCTVITRIAQIGRDPPGRSINFPRTVLQLAPHRAAALASPVLPRLRKSFRQFFRRSRENPRLGPTAGQWRTPWVAGGNRIEK